MVDIARSLHNVSQTLCKDQLLKYFSNGLADNRGFEWSKPLRIQQPERILHDTVQAKTDHEDPCLLDSNKQTLEANNIHAHSLIQPMEPTTVSAGHSTRNNTTEVIETVQLRQKDPAELLNDAFCTFCDGPLDLYGLCQTCWDDCTNADAFGYSSNGLRSFVESTEHKSLDCVPNDDLGGILDPAVLVNRE